MIKQRKNRSWANHLNVDTRVLKQSLRSLRCGHLNKNDRMSLDKASGFRYPILSDKITSYGFDGIYTNGVDWFKINYSKYKISISKISGRPHFDKNGIIYQELN